MRSPIRRLTSLLSWVQAYAAFAAVVPSHQPDRSTELMAYLRVSVREAQRCGGTRWRAHDQQFGMQAGPYPVERLDVTPDSNIQRNFLVDKARRGKDPVVLTALRPITRQRSARWSRQRKWFIARRKQNHLRQKVISCKVFPTVQFRQRGMQLRG